MQTIENHKKMVRRFYEELWNKWNYAIIGEILTPDIGFHGSLGAHKNGHKGFIDYAEMVRAAFPDFTNSVEELIAELGAAFLCAELSITSEPRPDHASYIANWLSVLKSDNRAIFAASAKANQAVSYLKSLQEKKEEK